MKEIKWSAEAAADLEAIKRYIAQDSPSYATMFIEKIFANVERLGQHPLFGRVVPEFADPHYREILYGNYRIIYTPLEDVVRIYAVVHGRRDLRKGDLKPSN